MYPLPKNKAVHHVEKNNNTVLYTWKMLGEQILNVLTTNKIITSIMWGSGGVN